MTRAIDRLVICGAGGRARLPEDCWWEMVFAAQPPVSVEEPADDGEGHGWRYRKVPPSARKTVAEGVAAPPADARPPWLDRDLGGRGTVAGSVALERLRRGGDGARLRPRPRRGRQARARGVLIHRLLQALPDIPDAAGGGSPAPPSPERRTRSARTSET